MNLMKNFNKNYLLQNLKKSKVVLSIFIFIIPILNTIIELMILTANDTALLSPIQISLLSLIGTYFLPIIISICLFNYIYKRKSVDFINSMPISRKSIFITNTVLGISIIILTIILNAILTLVVSLLLDRPILISMLLDYIWYVSLIYIYVFTATNLAMTISGNAITQVILTMLLLFLVPYSTDFTKTLYEQNTFNTYIRCTSEECRPKEYYCYEDETCLSNLKNNLYPLYLEKIENDNYTPPYFIVYNSLVGKESKIDITSSLKMLILSIIYILLGYKLFIQRKMEVNETTFKNIHHHNIIKSLTLIPIASISYVILKESNIISSIFVVIIMLIYFLIYDLITKKSITNIRLTAIYFFITITIIVGACYLIDIKTSNNLILDYKDIDSIAIKLSNDINSTNNKIIYIENPELISLIIKAGFDEDENSSNGFTIYLKEKDNTEYKSYISINKKTYTKILNMLNQEETYRTTYKSLNKKNIYAVKLGNKLYNYNESKKYIDIIEAALNNLTLEEFINLQNKYQYIYDSYNITIYTYESYDRQEQTISGYINYELLNTIINDYNKDLSNNISTTIPKDYYIYYENAYLSNTYNIDYYVLKSAKNELYEFMLKNINDKIDMKDKYFSFKIEINKKEYIYTTNKVTEIQEILNAKYQEIKDTDEYKNYHKYNYETGVSYYD